MQSISLDTKSQDENMQSAFQDLEVLMVRAGEMVRPAALSIPFKLMSELGPTRSIAQR